MSRKRLSRTSRRYDPAIRRAARALANRKSRTGEYRFTGLLLLGCGLLLLAFNAPAFVLAGEQLGWTASEGSIVRSAAVRDDSWTNAAVRLIRMEYGATRDWEVRLTVQFRPGGPDRTVTHAFGWQRTRSEAVRIAGLFVPDQPVRIWYDPADPDRNCLEREDGRVTLMLALAGFVLFSVGGGYFMYAATQAEAA